MRESRSGAGSRWWGWIVAAAGAAVVLAGVAAWWLVDPLSVSEPKDRASAIQAAFTIAFGFGGIATLGLFTRRQWHQERVHEHERQVAADARRDSERAYGHQQRVADDARHDAEQRRITEQYMKAVEQLGHEKAPVRLGGLYALDRLGRNHPEQRQVIADVWCAYLRRRYTPPADILDEAGEREDGEETADRTEEQLQADAEAADEYEVRMTAQRLLIGHLKDPRPGEERDGTRPEESEEYWHLEQVDLTGAVLVDAIFSDCRLPTLKADRARFCRSASFFGVYFEGVAWFDGATFESDTVFRETRFADHARFVGARFVGHAGFFGARFVELAEFAGARFGGGAGFAGARFESGANFIGARFDSGAEFNGTRFAGGAAFNGARFESDAWFGEAQFEDDAWFAWARFAGGAAFNGAGFEGGVGFAMARFVGRAEFAGARFGGPEGDAEDAFAPASEDLMSGVIVDRIDFEGGAHVWPTGLGTVADGDHWRLVRIEN